MEDAVGSVVTCMLSTLAEIRIRHTKQPECLSLALPHVQNCWWLEGKGLPAAAQHDKLLPLLASNKLSEISCSQFMNIFAWAVIPPPMSMSHTLTHTHSKKMKGLLSSAFISHQITNLTCIKQMFCFCFLSRSAVSLEVWKQPATRYTAHNHFSFNPPLCEQRLVFLQTELGATQFCCPVYSFHFGWNNYRFWLQRNINGVLTK